MKHLESESGYWLYNSKNNELEDKVIKKVYNEVLDSKVLVLPRRVNFKNLYMKSLKYIKGEYNEPPWIHYPTEKLINLWLI